jgi:hypothetical protein
MTHPFLDPSRCTSVARKGDRIRLVVATPEGPELLAVYPSNEEARKLAAELLAAAE